MRLEERIVLDGAAIVTLDQAVSSMSDTSPVNESSDSSIEAHAPAEPVSSPPKN